MLELLRSALWGEAGLFPFEICVIEAVKSKLDDCTASRLQSQVDAINFIQRLSDGKEVNLYRRRLGKVVFDDNLRFQNLPDETLLASVVLNKPGERANLKVDVWLANGRLFSLVFNKPPKSLFAGANLKTSIPEVADVKVWADPMNRSSIRVSETPKQSVLTGWASEWQVKGWIDSLSPPLEPTERISYCSRINSKLPPDYIELIEQTEGGRVFTCVVYGLKDIRQVVGSKWNYYIIAEINELGALGIKDGDQSGRMYFMQYEDNDVRMIGTSFQRAVANLLNLTPPNS